MISSSTKTALSAIAALLMAAGIATGDAITISISGCHTSYSYEANVWNDTLAGGGGVCGPDGNQQG